MYKRLLSLLLLFCIVDAYANDHQTVVTDSLYQLGDTTFIKTKKSVLRQWWEGIAHGNVDHTFERPLDITFGAAPYYSQESGVGIGGSLTSLFRINRTDSLMQPSNFSLLGGASVNGTYSFGLEGNANFTQNKRLSFFAQFRHMRRNWWGIDYKSCDVNEKCDNEINRVNVNLDYQQRFAGNWYWGLSAQFNFVKASPDSISYLQGQPSGGTFSGLGVLVQYDSRDFVLNPQRGIYFLYRLVYYPEWLGKAQSDVYRTTVRFNAYHKVWKNAILAYDFYAESNTSNGIVPWQLREEINEDDCRMRGYYSGRYMDCNQTCAQVELRQRVWKRIGLVAWGGLGCLYTDSSDLTFRSILPNAGVGFRFEIKHRTNVRLDLGFGRDATAIAFGFSEAF